MSNYTERYYAYFNYMVATSRLFTNLYPLRDDLVKNLISLKGYQRLKGNSLADSHRVAELLHSSWFTWGLLTEIEQHANLAHLNSPWSLVQVY